MRLISLEELRKITAIDVPESDPIVLYNLFTQMEEFCRNTNGGIGLAGVQVGIPWKIFIARQDQVYRYFIDCQYEGIGDKYISMESCLSLELGSASVVYYQVERFKKIRLFGKELVKVENPVLTNIDIIVEDLFAVVVEHEIDHGFGIVISDIGTPVSFWR